MLKSGALLPPLAATGTAPGQLLHVKLHYSKLFLKKIVIRSTLKHVWYYKYLYFINKLDYGYNNPIRCSLEEIGSLKCLSAASSGALALSGNEAFGGSARVCHPSTHHVNVWMEASSNLA